MTLDEAENLCIAAAGRPGGLYPMNWGDIIKGLVAIGVLKLEENAPAPPRLEEMETALAGAFVSIRIGDSRHSGPLTPAGAISVLGTLAAAGFEVVRMGERPQR